MDRNDMGQAIAQEIARSIARKIAVGITLFIAFLIFIAVGGGVVQLLWNWLLPDLLHVRTVSFWEALGLLALCRILFGGFGRGGGSHAGRRRGQSRDWWKPSRPDASETAGASTPVHE
jgi:hypothetical protein